MKIGIFLNELSIGGTEKAACAWAGLLKRVGGHQIKVLTLEDGPRRADLERHGIPLHVLGVDASPADIAGQIQGLDVVHAHAPGFPHRGDILGEAVACLGKGIPVVQTNIFGKIENPKENEWTRIRLFISWTSCVQAARRAGRRLDLEFFKHQSVASYPLVLPEENEIVELSAKACALRANLGVRKQEILLGRFSRPERNKWSPLVLKAFLHARRENRMIRLLLREPPPEVASRLMTEGLGARWNPSSAKPTESPVLILPATADPRELVLSQMACDVILHTSSIGESFGYGIAEPMAVCKPVITNSVPWHDQAQIELVRHGECGLIASTVGRMKAAILKTADSESLRREMGIRARSHILRLADPLESTNRVEMAMRCAIEQCDNPHAEEDLEIAHRTSEYLEKHQWGGTLSEKAWLYGMDMKVNLLRWQKRTRSKLGDF